MDSLGDPLPTGAVARLGSRRLWHRDLHHFAISADAKILVTQGHAGTGAPSMRLWDTSSGKLLREIRVEDSELTAAAFSPDGKLLPSAWTNGPADDASGCGSCPTALK